MTLLASSPGVNDNLRLYRTDGPPSSLREGTINPPLTIFADPDQAAFSLSFLFRNAAHVIGFWGPPSYLYTVGLNGLSPPMSTLTLPYLDWYGYRQNFELFDPNNPLWSTLGAPVNNLQTALVVQSEFVDPELPMPTSALSSRERESRFREIEDRMRSEIRRSGR